MLTSEHDPFVAHFDDRPLLPSTRAWDISSKAAKVCHQSVQQKDHVPKWAYIATYPISFTPSSVKIHDKVVAKRVYHNSLDLNRKHIPAGFASWMCGLSPTSQIIRPCDINCIRSNESSSVNHFWTDTQAISDVTFKTMSHHFQDCYLRWTFMQIMTLVLQLGACWWLSCDEWHPIGRQLTNLSASVKHETSPNF